MRRGWDIEGSVHINTRELLTSTVIETRFFIVVCLVEVQYFAFLSCQRKVQNQTKFILE